MEFPNILQQLNLLGKAVILGFAVGLCSCVIEVLRKTFKLRGTIMLIIDLLFWFVTAIAVFFISAWFCGGYARVHFILAVFLGWGAFAMSIGVLLDKILNRFINGLRHLSKILKGVLLRLKAVIKKTMISNSI